MPAARVLVVDDHPVFAQALAALLGTHEDLKVVGTAERIADAMALAAELRPDLAVVDVLLGDSSGLALAAQLTEALPTRVVMISCKDDPETVTAAIRVGAHGFVPKDSPPQELVDALRGALQGHTWVSPRLLTGVFRNLTEGPAPRPEEQRIALLSRRERDVLGCLVAGMSRADIAAELFLSVNTVRSHIQRVLTKLNVHSTLEAAALGRRAGVRPPPRVDGPRPRTT